MKFLFYRCKKKRTTLKCLSMGVEDRHRLSQPALAEFILAKHNCDNKNEPKNDATIRTVNISFFGSYILFSKRGKKRGKRGWILKKTSRGNLLRGYSENLPKSPHSSQPVSSYKEVILPRVNIQARLPSMNGVNRLSSGLY